MSYEAIIAKVRSGGPGASFNQMTYGLNASAKTRVTALLQRDARRYPAGSDIILEGDESGPFFLVLDGWVALNKSLKDGHVQTIDIILPADVIMPSAEGVSVFDVHALTDVTVCAVPMQELDNLEAADPPHMWTSIRALSAAAKARIAERMLRLGQGSAEVRIAYFLTELYLRISACSDNQDMVFHLPLTQQQIGEFVGLSSVHVCRTLRRLSRNGLIDTSSHLKIVINDFDSIANIAQIDINQLKAEILPSDC